MGEKDIANNKLCMYKSVLGVKSQTLLTKAYGTYSPLLYRIIVFLIRPINMSK